MGFYYPYHFHLLSHVHAGRARLESLAKSIGGDSGIDDTPGEVRVIFVDQGSRGSPPLLQPILKEGGIIVQTMVIDHHQSDDFPEASQVPFFVDR